MAKIIWNVEIFNEQSREWKTIAEIEFNYYSRKGVMEHIRDKRPEILRKIKANQIWDVKVKSWD